MKRILIATTTLLLSAHAFATDASSADIAQKLGWTDDPLANNLCKGYYIDQPVINPHGPDSHLVDYIADSSSITKKGVSTLKGHVKITQGDREVTSNTATLLRNPETNNPKQFDLSGNIEIREPGVVIYAEKVKIWLHEKEWQIWNGLYRVGLGIKSVVHGATPTRDPKVVGITARGQADTIKQTKPKVWDLYNTTYTTCKPNCNDWHIKAKHIHLDKNSEIGTAKNATLYVKNIPIFWLPYLRFPLTPKRESGLLTPNYGTSNSFGANLTLPVYWNIAPNYDAILTPIFTDKRGIVLQNYFRYLTANSFGNVNFTVTPSDAAFNTLRNQLEQEYSGQPKSATQLNNLKNASDSRYLIGWQDKTQINQHLFANVNYTHVSDDYYMEDYFSNPEVNDPTMDQLNQQAQIDYFEKKWRLDVNFQQYQTLHPLNQASIYNQYSRLPEIDFNGTAGYRPYGMQFSLNSSLTDFGEQKNPFSYNLDNPTVGNRFDIDPTMALPLHDDFLFFTPSLQAELTGYNLQRPNPGANSNPSRSIPIFNIDSGMYFDRQTTLFGKAYTETLEPHIYYLYVPYRNQNNLPLFDTIDNSAPLSFNYDQMFVDNRFSDIDRIGDANQITMAMTTQFRDANTGNVKANASLGEIYYFANRSVQACTATNHNNPNDPVCQLNLPVESTERVSPLAGQLGYNVTQLWNITGDLVYNPEKKWIDNQTYNLSYDGDNQHILNFSYTYARDADVDPNAPTPPADSDLNNLHQAGVSGFWPINFRWKGLSAVNFSLNRHHFQSYLYGVEYDACCWSVRAIVDRAFTGLNPSFNNTYDNRFLLQFALTGFTSLGTHDPGNLLSDSIQNYNEQFGKNTY